MLHTRSRSTTFGTASENVFAPPAHDDGTAELCAAYADQSARGTEPPIQLNRDCEPGSPVDTSADDNNDAGVRPRNSPMPPRSTPGVVLVKRPSPLATTPLRTCPLRL